MEITKREIAASIAIICLMMLFGVLIHGRIQGGIVESNELYFTALRIESDASMFEYARRTNSGRIIACGEFEAVEPIHNADIGEVLFLQQVRERYTMHTRVEAYTTTDSKGRTQTHSRVVTYYTWDYCGGYEDKPDSVRFIGAEMDFGALAFKPEHSRHFGETGTRVGNVRWHYEYKPVLFTGLIAASTSEGGQLTRYDGGSPVKVEAYANIAEKLEALEASARVSATRFWILWVMLSTWIVLGFYFMENLWLNG